MGKAPQTNKNHLNRPASRRKGQINLGIEEIFINEKL